MYLKRKIDEYLLEWKKNEERLPLIIKGARQVGKTESINHFAEQNYSNIVSINFVPPVYNFINDRLVDESAVLRPLLWHLILYVFRYFSRKWQKISDCECPDLIQNETPVRFLYGTQKNVRSDRAESSWHSN